MRHHGKFVSVLVKLVLFLSCLCFCSGNPVRVPKMIRLTQERLTCSPFMACKYAICLWERNPTISPDRCHFVDSYCTCPSNRFCAPTDRITPGSKILTFEYRCKDPSTVLRQS